MQPVKMTVTRRYIGEEGSKKPGEILVVTERRANQLEDNGVAIREGANLKKPELPELGPAQPLQSSLAAPVLPGLTASTPAAEGGGQSRSTMPIASGRASTPSTPATGDGGTPTKRGRGRPPKVRT